MKAPPHVVILVGHGAPPLGYPRDRVARLKALEGKRRATGGPMTEEEMALDREIRAIPRTPQNDPYSAGIEALGNALRPLLGDATLLIAYNELCGPSLEEALARAAAEGARAITVVPTMLTPGGVHSEVEIPETIEEAKARLPGVELRYAWPFDLTQVAALLAARARACAPPS